MEPILQPGGARALWKANLPDQATGWAWLGQAGFLLRHAGQRWLLDPYLSDHLAQKYAGTDFPHERLMPPPLAAEEMRDLDWVLCSHRHGDHMDPGALPVLAAQSPTCRFLVPRAERDAAVKLGLPSARLILANAGDTFRMGSTLTLHVVPSAHETLKVNAEGEHHFLGFILQLGALTLYHSGDCVVYEGLAERLRAGRVEVALLPVNGRRAPLTARGILGNMTFEEARALCLAAGIGTLVPHHFGMFAFNSLAPAELRRSAAQPGPGPRCLLPSLATHFLFTPATNPSTPQSA